MKEIIYILPFLFFSLLNAQTHILPPEGSGSWNNKNALAKPVPVHIQKHFDIAIDEIEKMLKGEKTLSFKRAVYLVENAYYEGKISWEEYNNEILRIKPLLHKMIYNHNLQQHKTAGNWATFTFMSDSIPENNFKPYQYDIENFMNGTKDCYMVSHLLKAKKGNCRSLPYLYKILANELNAEAFLAAVPMHIYIKHRDEDGIWWNLEITTGSFSRSSFIMETFNVSEEAIKSGLFMKALSDIESVAYCLYDLVIFYERKTGRYSDDFVKKCYEIGLQYYPVSQLQNLKVNDLLFRLENKMMAMGLKDYRELPEYPELMSEFQIMDSTIKYISKIGHSTMLPETYKTMFNEVREQQIRLKSEKK